MKTPVVGKDGLVTSMDSLSSLVAEKLVTSLKDRIKPYMPYYLAMELIDPTAPRGNPLATTWNAVKDICEKYDINYTEVRAEILEMRDDSVELSLSDISLCKSNLLKFYKRNMDKEKLTWRPMQKLSSNCLLKLY